MLIFGWGVSGGHFFLLKEENEFEMMGGSDEPPGA